MKVTYVIVISLFLNTMSVKIVESFCWLVLFFIYLETTTAFLCNQETLFLRKIPLQIFLRFPVGNFPR